MKKTLRSVPSLKVLLLSYTTLFVLLVVVRNFQYWSIKQKSTNLTELVSKSIQRQSALSAIHNSSINEQSAILNLLYYPDKSNNPDKVEKILSDINRKDSLLVAFALSIHTQDEQLIFNNLKASSGIITENQYQFFKLIKYGKYDEAIKIYNDLLSLSFQDFQQQSVRLLNYTGKLDNSQIHSIEKQISAINNLNKWISAALIILMVFLGITYIKMAKLIRKTNRELGESERRYRTLTEQTNEIIVKCDSSGKFIFANDSFKKRLGYNDDELSGLTISDILAEGSLALDQYSKSTEVITNVQKVFKSKSGKKIYIEGTILLEFNNGNFKWSMGFFNDVTEKKILEESLIASELKFRDFFNLAPIPIWVYDAETFKFVIVNKAALKHYGYTEEEFLNMTIMDIGQEEDSSKEKKESSINEKTSNSSENGRGRSNYTHLKKDFEKIDVEIYTSPIIINNNKCILSIAIDVTERNQYENKITKAIIKTQEDERYEIGCELHDNVCQLLAAANINLGLMKPSPESSVTGTYNHARESINLALAEIRNLSHRLAPAFFDNTRLDEAFGNLLRTFNIEDKYNISVYFNNTAMNYTINPEMQLNLYRILQEQLRNIIKYAKGTVIDVDVFIYNNKLKMRIADDGVGFDINSVKKGIGLANIKRRAELFSGKLQINSSPDNGCELLITIPMNEIN
jgi:PAS domain S-box-containing protein